MADFIEIKINDLDLLKGLAGMLARGKDMSPAMKNLGEADSCGQKPGEKSKQIT